MKSLAKMAAIQAMMAAVVLGVPIRKDPELEKPEEEKPKKTPDIYSPLDDNRYILQPHSNRTERTIDQVYEQLKKDAAKWALK